MRVELSLLQSLVFFFVNMMRNYFSFSFLFLFFFRQATFLFVFWIYLYWTVTCVGPRKQIYDTKIDCENDPKKLPIVTEDKKETLRQKKNAKRTKKKNPDVTRECELNWGNIYGDSYKEKTIINLEFQLSKWE